MATFPRKMADPRWRFILHGGCAETVPDATQQQKISENLQAVAVEVASALSSGSTAREAVVLAVSALEDCPMFNAGHGAALNSDGIHQVIDNLGHPFHISIRAR
jgi:beta-aspartyl-peptidase (threonine type)